MTYVNLSDLKAHLSDYARRVKRGETICLCERNKPFAELRPLGAARDLPWRPEPGLFRDWIQVPGDFLGSDDDLTGDFYGEDRGR